MSADITIDEIPVPDAIGAPGWDDFVAMTAVILACETEVYGTDDVALPAELRLPFYREPQGSARLLVARRGDHVVAGAGVVWSRDAPQEGWIDIHVLAGERRRGLGTRLADAADRLAAELAMVKTLIYAGSPDGPGERLTPPTGVGSVPADNAEVRFLLGRGYRLEQVERGSLLRLPIGAEAVARLREATIERSAGYRTVTWQGATPPELREGMAVLQERMSTDAPSAGLEEPAESWDAARVAAQEAELAAAPGDLLTTIAIETESGRAAGYTRFALPGPELAAHQWATIVRREDRGHRLGMLLKLENLVALQERWPGVPSIVTWNAEENRHMLDVNEAMGFEPIGYEGAWRKDLA